MRRRLLIAVLALAPAVAGCAGDETASIDAPMTLHVSSHAFLPGGPIPRVHSCDGEGRSPQLDVGGLPEGTSTVALIMDDPDASRGTFTHWLVWNVAAPGRSVAFPEGRAPGGALEGTNSADTVGYKGPCPPEDDGVHRYFFHAYAVDEVVGLTRGAERSDLIGALKDHVLAQGELMGTYDR